jgi:hypothetical protein
MPLQTLVRSDIILIIFLHFDILVKLYLIGNSDNWRSTVYIFLTDLCTSPIDHLWSKCVVSNKKQKTKFLM